MCLAQPGKILSLDRNDPFHKGLLTFGSVTMEASLILVPEAAPGDYVLVHAGFAIARMDHQAAAEALSVAPLSASSSSPETGLGMSHGVRGELP